MKPSILRAGVVGLSAGAYIFVSSVGPYGHANEEHAETHPFPNGAAWVLSTAINALSVSAVHTFVASVNNPMGDERIAIPDPELPKPTEA